MNSCPIFNAHFCFCFAATSFPSLSLCSQYSGRKRSLAWRWSCIHLRSGGNIHSWMGPFHPGREGTLNFKLYWYPKFYDHVPICWIITLGTFIHSVLIGWNKQDCSIIWIHKMDINKKGYISIYRLLSHLSRSLYFFASSCASAYNILNYLCIYVDTCFRNVTTALAHYRQIL